jgi:hypothetical protein
MKTYSSNAGVLKQEIKTVLMKNCKKAGLAYLVMKRKRNHSTIYDGMRSLIIY